MLESTILQKDEIINNLKKELNNFNVKRYEENNQKYIVLQQQFSNLETDYKELVLENKSLNEKLQEQQKIIDTLRKKNVIDIHIIYILW